jgi:REP element-mobilizing transposase RayT
MTQRFDPERHHRRTIRLKGYDYTLAGAYFITLVTHERQCLFREVAEGHMVLNALGCCVEEEWRRTPLLRPDVAVGEYVIMPNHVHGIILLTGSNVGAYGHTPHTHQAKPPSAQARRSW